jgi:hypothetical protein
MAEWFLALTPVALRAPSVSAKNHKQPEKRELRRLKTEKVIKSID